MRALLATSLIYSASALQQHWPHFPGFPSFPGFGHSSSSIVEEHVEEHHSDSHNVGDDDSPTKHHHASSDSTEDTSVFKAKHHVDSKNAAKHHHHATSHHRSSSKNSTALTPSSNNSSVMIEPSLNSTILTKCSKVNQFDGWKPINEERCLDANLILLRIFKTGTSSLGGVLRRIASRYGLNGVEEKEAVGMPEPLVSSDHFPMSMWEIQPFVKKIKNFTKPNIMITIVRHPIERWLSHFYYRASKKECPCEIMEFLQEYAKEKNRNFQINYLRQGHPKEPDMKVTPQQALDKYALVGITERFDDSITALMFMLGIDSYCDVLFINSKTSTSGTDHKGNHWLPHIPFEKQPKEVKEYIMSEKFQMSQHEDKELYDEAQKRLDKQIEAIGKERFMKRRDEYQKWKDQAQSFCDKDGESSFEDCYYSDQGCKHTCLDKFCKAHEKELRLVDDVKPLWGSEIFHAPLIQSVHG